MGDRRSQPQTTAPRNSRLFDSSGTKSKKVLSNILLSLLLQLLSASPQIGWVSKCYFTLLNTLGQNGTGNHPTCHTVSSGGKGSVLWLLYFFFCINVDCHAGLSNEQSFLFYPRRWFHAKQKRWQLVSFTL